MGPSAPPTYYDPIHKRRVFNADACGDTATRLPTPRLIIQSPPMPP